MGAILKSSISLRQICGRILKTAQKPAGAWFAEFSWTTPLTF